MANGKRNVLTFEQRLDVLKDLETSSISSVAKKYNVHHMTIRRIIEKAATITEFAEKDRNEKLRKKIRKPTYEELEQQLLTWFVKKKTVGEVVTDALFLEKAAELRQQIEACSHFKVSRGWLANFKRRHRIRLIRSYSEKSSADTNEAHTFVDDLKKFFEQENINLWNVYNMYESLLLWKALPVRTFAGKIENCASEYKIRKESVHVGLCANATGTHKIMPLVINKCKESKASRNFTNQPPDEILFVDWFENYFKKAVQTYQLEKGLCSKVVLLIDNSSSHKFPTNYVHDDQFQVIYLPLNIMSLIQPINQVIIDKMKRCYRHKLMQCLINYGNGLEEFYKKYTIEDCIEIISKAWNEVTRNNIKNMWKEIIVQLQIKNEKEEEGGEIKEEKEEDVITEIRQICTQIAGYDVTAEYIEDYLSACTEEENRFLREAEELDTEKKEHILGEKEAEMDEETDEGTNEERDIDWVEEKPEVTDEGERISGCEILLKQEEREELENIFIRLNCYKSRISRAAQLHLEGLKLSFLGDTQK